MHCATVSASFVLCATSLDVVTGFYFKRDDVTINNEADIDTKENLNPVVSQYSSKPSKRQKRSIWTTFLDHISAIVQPFHLEPLLVDSVNNMDDLGRLSEGKFRDTRSANVLLKKGVGGEKQSDIKPDSPAKENVGLTVDSAELEDVKKEMTRITELYNKAVGMEEKLHRRFLDDKINNDIKDGNLLQYLITHDPERMSLEFAVKEGLKSKPKLAEEVVKDLNSIIKVRRQMQNLERKFTKSRLPRLSEELLNDHLFQTLGPVRYNNDQWLENEYIQTLAGATDSPEPKTTYDEETDFCAPIWANKKVGATSKYEKAMLAEGLKIPKTWSRGKQDDKDIGNATEIKRIRSEIAQINQLYYEADRIDKMLTDHLVGIVVNNKKLNGDHILVINMEGIKSAKTEKFIKKMIPNYPDLKSKVATNLSKSLKLRKEMQILARQFEKNRIDKGVFSGKIAVPNNIIARETNIKKIITINDEYLKFKHDPELLDPHQKPESTITIKGEKKKEEKKNLQQ